MPSDDDRSQLRNVASSVLSATAVAAIVIGVVEWADLRSGAHDADLGLSLRLLAALVGWFALIGLILAIGAFVIPFAGLISRFAKRNRGLLAFWAIWICIMQWFNLYWVAMPVFSPDHVSLGLLDVLCFLAVGGLWLAVVVRLAASGSLVPVGDPRLADSLAFENA